MTMMIDSRVCAQYEAVRERYEAWFRERLPTVSFDEAADLLSERRDHLPSGATPTEMDLLERYAKATLPADYATFLSVSNGLLGDLFSVAHLIGKSERLSARELLPGFLVIGGNGGPDLFALDLRNANLSGVIQTPAAGMSPEAVLQRWASFTEWFLDHFGE